MWSYIIEIVLGVVQGLTEFIPVSSSGHVLLADLFMSGGTDHLFLEWINLGTVAALLIFFRQRLIQIAREVVVKKDFRLLRNIVIAMLPAGVAGFALASFIETAAFFTSAWTVVTALIGLGVIMIILEKLPKLSPVESLRALSWQRALLIGSAQVAALIPGTSRSGSTIVAGRLTGLSREQAAEFSFLVSIPIMLGVVAKLLLKSTDRAYFLDHAASLVAANLAAFVAGLFAIGFLMKFLKQHSLALFGWYRVILAVAVAAVLWYNT